MTSLFCDHVRYGMSDDTRVTPLSGGANSQVFLLEEPGREPVVCKRYFVNQNDSRDRQGAEAAALGFLESSGVAEAPRLLKLDREEATSLITYIEGEAVGVPDVEDVRNVATFVVRLVEISHGEAARQGGFAMASESFFAASGVLGNIDLRLGRLKDMRIETPLHEECAAFVSDRLLPAYETYAKACAERLSECGMAVDDEIPEAWRMLSPSDVGTHNAIRRADGSLAYIDYEYFGWDDPSKMLADFCLHPAMNLSESLQAEFLSGVMPALYAQGYRRERARAMFPLFGIKWCCIILNEFLRGEAARRQFSGVDGTLDRERVLRRQLDKAVNMLDSLDDRAAVFARLLNES